MTQKDLYGLRYFLAFAFVLISLFVYSGATGLKWIGGTKTEKEKSTGTGTGVRTYPRYFYHK
ncbi:MAG: hypothetical protein JNJ75_10450 [Cyclobacteriaceae bacterium]|nr:hypothetical protein [Cyclobacteriaceae bacterium]